MRSFMAGVGWVCGFMGCFGSNSLVLSGFWESEGQFPDMGSGFPGLKGRFPAVMG